MKTLQLTQMDARRQAVKYGIDVRTTERRMLSGALDKFVLVRKMECGSWLFVSCSLSGPGALLWRMTIATGLPPEIACPDAAAEYVLANKAVA